MAVALNHTIVHATDSDTSAAFLTEVLGLAPPGHFGHFRTVDVSNGVSLDYSNSDQVVPQHYAFLVDESEFDQIFGRIQERGLEYSADPARPTRRDQPPRQWPPGVYFPDPDGHFLEILTRPYGSG